MKLGYHTSYWTSKPPAGAVECIATAERLGFDSVWTAEVYGSDAFTPLAWWGAATSKVRLGTNIVQMSARTPAATAMTAITLDYLSGGRFVLGLGASGPQVVEGWYGQSYPRPLERTREYIEIIRAVVAREAPVAYSGNHYQLPFPGGTGLGKPLKSTVHPLRSHIPIYLAAQGPKNIALAGEIADGYLPFFFAPRNNDYYRAALAEGFSRRDGGQAPADFEVVAGPNIVFDDDLETAADALRPWVALYVGGMGAKEANFHAASIARLGYEAEVEKIQQLYLAGHKKDAIAAVPTAMVEDVALVGPPDRVKDGLARWSESVVTTLLISGDEAHLNKIVDLLS
ncbi:LLM class F420-dependent oxidoreductase [Solihabitans fulvus]|uniref:LLM class F420-dependent oxidoreductase n=1 Tax=Solihabitans fulvus TaxID=1892852 RepID=A0A5B2WK01_9PSEU|nr:LLM class F420-dependent oxidoreductase [Solihabitans fulvus]KAA2251234.1 LLM class F420-dependent oxidoreductase [Solihabitans fulvus]